MTDLLFYGDTERSPTLRHELPVPIGDAFLLGIVNGRRHIMVNRLERARVEAAAPDAVFHDIEELGFREMLQAGTPFHEVELELASRAAAAMGVREAIADPNIPVAVADRLRADGIALHPDYPAVAARRRRKSEAELAGIRRAQAAAEAGMAAAAAMLRESQRDGDRLRHGGEVLTADAVRSELREACRRAGATAPLDVIVASTWSGGGHDPGTGPLPANLPIVIDLWPQDEQSGCWADMTRTLVVGTVGDDVRELERLVRTSLDRARDAVRPGITGRELHAIVCELFEAAGHPTQRTGPGAEPHDGFQFSLGHGVGLAVHEAPGLGMTGLDELLAGDVIAMEPGLTVHAIGEVRLEDLLLVTDGGSRTLTSYPYELTP